MRRQNLASILPALHLCLEALGACSWANFLALVKVWGAFQIARSNPQARPADLSYCFRRPVLLGVSRVTHEAGGVPATPRDQWHPAGAHLELAPRAYPGTRSRVQEQERHTYSDGSRLFLSMAEDIGEGGGVPGGGGAPFVARGWPAAWTRTPSGARAPPLLRLLLLGRSAGDLAPPHSRTVTALPSNAKERERKLITWLPCAGGRGRGPGSSPASLRQLRQLPLLLRT